MPRTKVSRTRPPECVTAKITLQGQTFPFRLYTRRLPLGDYGTIHYYWMPAPEFHSLTPKSTTANFRSCLGHWKAAMQTCGLWEDIEQQVTYLLAASYPLVCRSKSLQKIYRDAFLDPTRVSYAATGLPEEARQRIQQVVDARDRFGLQRELDQVLGRYHAPAGMLPRLQEAFRRWVGHGLVLMREHGQDGVSKYLEEVRTWLNRFRKKGGDPWVRRFIDMYSYEAKVSFYTCFANTWIGLLPWLKEHRALDQLSERFLRLWHNQNQPIEIPPGRTPGGLYYPTGGQAIGFPSTGTPEAVRQVITWQTPQSEPQFIPDVFSGQVLSLHPLSSFFMKDPALCAIAGRFLSSDSFEEVMSRGRSENHPMYWQLIGAILTAAHSYRNALDSQAQQRGVRYRGGNAVETIGTGPEPEGGAEASLIEDFAVAQGKSCPECGGSLRLDTLFPAESDSAHFSVGYRCRSCQRAVPIEYRRSDLEDFLASSR